MTATRGLFEIGHIVKIQNNNCNQGQWSSVTNYQAEQACRNKTKPE